MITSNFQQHHECAVSLILEAPLSGGGALLAAAVGVASDMFEGIAHHAVVIPGDGYDIQAYLNIAERINHDTLCMFNTFTNLFSPNWSRVKYLVVRS
jgi:hypothetical protein